MATLNQIAQSYIDSVGKPFDHILKERIKFSIKYWRAKLIRQEFERNGADESLLQSFVMELVEVDIGDSCLIKTGCKILRTKDKIPRPINTKGTNNFVYFGKIKIGCGSSIGSFIESSNNEIQFSMYEQYTADLGRFQYKNGYGYVYSNKLLRFVQIEGYFENPEDVVSMCEDSSNCVTDNEEFPIGLHMLDTILRGLRTAELQLLTDDQEVKIDE